MHGCDDDDLGLSALTDDQLVELGIAVAREALSRNPAMQAAFAQSMLDERARVEAAAQGAEKARDAEAKRIAKQAEVAFEHEARERQRLKVQGAMAEYLRRGAEIIGQAPSNITLVWTTSNIPRTRPRLQLSLGKKSSWHLVDYGASDDELYTSPGLRPKRVELLPWCREASAAIRALGVDRDMSVNGEEL